MLAIEGKLAVFTISYCSIVQKIDIVLFHSIPKCPRTYFFDLNAKKRKIELFGRVQQLDSHVSLGCSRYFERAPIQRFKRIRDVVEIKSAGQTRTSVLRVSPRIVKVVVLVTNLSHTRTQAHDEFQPHAR